MFVIVLRSDFVDNSNLAAHGFKNTLYRELTCAPVQSTAGQYYTHVRGKVS